MKNWYSGDQYSLDELEFADGTKWSPEDVASRAVTRGTSTNAVASAEPSSAPAAPEAFSTVSPSSAMSESEVGVFSESEAKESLVVLSPYTAGGRCQTNTTTNMRSIDNAGYSLGQRMDQCQQNDRTGQ